MHLDSRLLILHGINSRNSLHIEYLKLLYTIRCGDTGHIARECPDEAGDEERSCYNCHETGHISRDCPEEKRQPRGERRSQECYK